MADQRNGGISWCDETWNYLRGCLDDNKDCANCYAKHLAATRLATSPKYIGLAVMTPSGPKWTGKVTMDEDDLMKPLKWRRPRLVFVNAMSDPWYEAVPDAWVDAGFAVMLLANWHNYQVLTKRPDRALAYFKAEPWERIVERARTLIAGSKAGSRAWRQAPFTLNAGAFPLKHIWLGASMGHQAAVDEKMPHLADPILGKLFSVIWVSAEPLLEELDFTPPEWRGTNTNRNDWLQAIDWMVGGGESDRNTHKARPTPLQAARALRDASIDRRDMGRPWGLPFHWKQWGEWSPVTHYALGGHYLAQNNLVYKPGSVQVAGGGTVARLGVRDAGRLMDGREWNEYPLAFQPAR